MTEADKKARKHRQYNRRWSRANPEKVRNTYRRSVAKKKAARLCVRCGLGSLESKTLCANCLEKSKKASAKWRAANIEKLRRKERLAMRAKRRAHPQKYRQYRRSYYVAKRDQLLEQRRIREGQIPRAEYLKQVRRASRGATFKPGPQPDDDLNAEIERLYEAKRGERAEIDRGNWLEIKLELDARTGVHRSVDAYQMRLKRYRMRKATS